MHVAEFSNSDTAAALVAAGSVPALVQCLQGSESSNEVGLRVAAASALQSLASHGPKCHAAVAAAAAAPALVQLLKDSSSVDVQKMAAAALRNLARDGSTLGAAVLAAGAVPVLLRRLTAAAAAATARGCSLRQQKQ